MECSICNAYAVPLGWLPETLCCAKPAATYVLFALPLPDGRQWSCQFYEEIESSCSKVQFKKGNILQLVLQKKIPLHNWSSLLVRFIPVLSFTPLNPSKDGWRQDRAGCRQLSASITALAFVGHATISMQRSLNVTPNNLGQRVYLMT